MPATTLRATAALAISAAALTAAAAPASAATETATVARAVDGNTVRVLVAGRARTVDLLGVRAPDDCFTAEARRALRRKLPRGARVKLVSDPRRGGRGRYVFRGRAFVNAAILRAGAGTPARLRGLQRASTLRFATRAAENAERGLFGECAFDDDADVTFTPAPDETADQPTTQAPAAPATPGAAEDADAIRSALTGKQLLDLNSGQGFSEQNVTRFCPGNRADRTEEFNGDSGFTRSELSGTWSITGTLRQADGTLLAAVVFTADDVTFDQRQITVSLSPDGKVRRPAAKASELQQGGECSAPQPDGVVQNDTTTARSAATQQLTGKRFTTNGAVVDFCTGTRAVRTENGTKVLDGAWTLEWAFTSADGTVAIVTLRDSSTATSRRLLVALPASGSPQVQDLGANGDAVTGTAAATAC